MLYLLIWREYQFNYIANSRHVVTAVSEEPVPKTLHEHLL